MPEPFTTRALSVRELRLDADRGALYAVLDACGEPRVLEKVRELGPEHAASLYRGRAEEDLYAIAPYLVRVGPELLAWLTETLWADPWGIFIACDSALEPLRTHLRKFLLVDGPDGEQWYFRFYDPRVLARFLSTCDDAQRDELFGPVAAYGWTDPDSYGVLLASPAPREPQDEPQRTPPRITVRAP